MIQVHEPVSSDLGVAEDGSSLVEIISESGEVSVGGEDFVLRHLNIYIHN